jgi:hypothetical protein
MLTAHPPSATPDRRRAPAPPTHDDAEASIGLCDCPRCRDERTRRGTHPLLGAVLIALYDVGDLLHILRRSHGCADPARCELCREARMTWAVLGTLECGLEGEFAFAADSKLARRRAHSERVRSDGARRSPRPWRPGRGQNHPVHPLAVMAMDDLAGALAALRDGHRCRQGDCFVCEQAEVGAYLVPMLTAAIAATLLERGGVTAGREEFLHLLKTGGRQG